MAASALFASVTVALAFTIMITLMISNGVGENIPVIETFAQVQSMDESEAPQTNGLLLQGVNATSPVGRERHLQHSY